jgi:hypothetical protein
MIVLIKILFLLFGIIAALVFGLIILLFTITSMIESNDHYEPED